MGSEKFFLFCCSVLTLTSYLDNGVKSELSDYYLFVKKFTLIICYISFVHIESINFKIMIESIIELELGDFVFLFKT